MNVSKKKLNLVNGYYRYYGIADKEQRKKYINTWFPYSEVIIKGKSKRFIEKANAFITLKRCDKDTMWHLYQREFNPVTIYDLDKHPSDGISYILLRLNSIDDSSYGIWYTKTGNQKKDDFYRKEMMKYIYAQKRLNGNKMLAKAVELGADKDSIDYN